MNKYMQAGYILNYHNSLSQDPKKLNIGSNLLLAGVHGPLTLLLKMWSDFKNCNNSVCTTKVKWMTGPKLKYVMRTVIFLKSLGSSVDMTLVSTLLTAKLLYLMIQPIILTLFRLGFLGFPWTGGGHQTPPPFLKNYRRYRHETYTTN